MTPNPAFERTRRQQAWLPTVATVRGVAPALLRCWRAAQREPLDVESDEMQYMSMEAQGSEAGLFVGGSELNHLALERLAELLKDIGFSVRKKSRTEGTLRVYVKKQNEYPLLNPRFVQSGPSERCLRIWVLSKGNDPTLDLVLASFENTPDCTFVPLSETSNQYRYHGSFEIPLRSVSETSFGEFGVSEVSKPLTDIFRLLAPR